MNTYGSRKSSGIVGAGGLIRNSSGEWLTGFSINLGICSVKIAELWGIYEGFLLAWNVGIRDIHVDVDGACAIQIITNGCNSVNDCYPLIRGIKELMSREWR